MKRPMDILRSRLQPLLGESRTREVLGRFQSEIPLYLSAHSKEDSKVFRAFIQFFEFNYRNPLYSVIDEDRYHLVLHEFEEEYVAIVLKFTEQGPSGIDIMDLERDLVDLTSRSEEFNMTVELGDLIGNLILRTIRRPLLLFKRWRLRKGRLLKSMLDDPVSAEMWYSIEYVSPILNRFLFRLPYFRQLRGDTDLIDLVFFAMQTGDEFLDGVIDDMRKAGRLDELLDDLRTDTGRWEFYEKNGRICVSGQLADLAGDIMTYGYSSKYDCSYSFLYERLVRTVDELNTRLENLAENASLRLAIIDFFNFCLSTAKDDIYFVARYGDTPVPLPFIRWHFRKKNDMVMMKWILLRSQALMLPLIGESKLREWGAFLHNAQLFDDLRDVKIDMGLQPNVLHSLSFYTYKEEWNWLLENAERLPAHLVLKDILDVNFNMPRSVLHCMTFARVDGLKNFDWLTIKGAHLHWHWHWMSSSSKYKEGSSKKFLLKEYFNGSRHSTGSYLMDMALESIHRLQSLMADEKLSISLRSGYLFDMLMYDSVFRDRVSKHASLKQRYLLKMNGFFIGPGLRSELLTKTLKVELSRADVSLSEVEKTLLVQVLDEDVF
jgi:hypothetical protein